MDRPNMGFALYLGLLLLGPQLPINKFIHVSDTNAGLSVAAAGLVVWFMLAPRLPLRAVLTMPTVLGLIVFAMYLLLVSFASGRLVSIMYALQYAFYALLGGLLIPAYLVHRTQQGRQAEVWRIVAWIGAIYVAGIIVSLWTGPMWTFQGPGGKHYGSLLILRAAGFSESPNSAGGIAAVLTAFFLFLYRPMRQRSSAMTTLCLAGLSLMGLLLTLSRSAIGAFVLAIFLLGALLAFRALFLRGRVGRLRLRPVPIAFVVLGLVAGVVSYQQRIVSAAWERLVLNQNYLDEDVDGRLERWTTGAERWAALSPTERIIGAGFRSGSQNVHRKTFITSHNAYIEFLGDAGVMGVLIFMTILAAAMLRATRLILLNPNEPMTRFCWCGLTILIIHNMTEVFFYDIPTMTCLILLLACNELAGRRVAAVAGGPARSLIHGTARDTSLAALSR